MQLKKVLITSCVAASLLGVVGCSTKQPTQTETENTPVTEQVSSELQLADLSLYALETDKPAIENTHIYEINYENLKEFLREDGKSRLLYLGAPDCPHCREALPNVHELAAKYNVPVYHLPIYKLSDEDYKNALKDLDAITMEVQGTGEKDFFIPHLFVIENGKLNENLSHIGYTAEMDYSYLFEAVLDGGK